MSLIGTKAPEWTATACVNGEQKEISSKDYAGKWYVLYWYPLDFTFVCPSEILAYSNRVPQFEEKNVKVVAVSVDSQFSHFAWRNTEPKDGGLGPVKFPMVADITKQIARDYDVLIENDGVALRGTFLIDRDGVVRHQLVNDLPLGRNADEALRMVDALQFHEENGEVCPAGWQKGEEGMVADQKGVAEYLGSHSEKL